MGTKLIQFGKFFSHISAAKYTTHMPPKKKPTGVKSKKIFVLDTSVILHDHNALRHFDEHDVVLPITVLEELDQFKKGNDSLHYEARSFIRMLDELATEHSLQDWIPLNTTHGSQLKVEMNESASVDGGRGRFGVNTRIDTRLCRRCLANISADHIAHKQLIHLIVANPGHFHRLFYGHCTQTLVS